MGAAIPGGSWYHDDETRQSCTPDCFIMRPDRPGKGSGQIKSVAEPIFRDKWKADGIIQPPLYVVVQAMQEAKLTGCEWFCCIALVVGFGIDAYVVDIPIHEGAMSRLDADIREFWCSVDNGQMPQPNFERDAKLLSKLLGCNKPPIDLSANNEILEWRESYVRLGQLKKECERDRSKIKAQLTAAMNGASVATYNRKIIATAKIVHRDGYKVGPCEYTDVRFKK
jgi:hypothetical protein